MVERDEPELEDEEKRRQENMQKVMAKVARLKESLVKEQRQSESAKAAPKVTRDDSELGNTWEDSKPGNTWGDSKLGNTWEDSNLGAAWEDSKPVNTNDDPKPGNVKEEPKPANAQEDPKPRNAAPLSSKNYTEVESVAELRRLNDGLRDWGGRWLQALTDQKKDDHKGRIIATLAVIVAIIFGAVGVLVNTNKQADIVGQKVQASQFVITSPPEGASVGIGQKVRGNTPRPDLNHHILVTMIRTGTMVLAPAFPSRDGTFSGEARFGDQTVGEDDEFSIRAVATTDTLVNGPIASIPGDAMLSEAVHVRRVFSVPLVAGPGPTITAPTDGLKVGKEYQIKGTTSLKDWNHYVVVTPLRIGTAFVQDQPATINRTDGSFTGRAVFGTTQVGIGERFSIRIIATKSTLPAAPLTNAPADAVFSNTVTVLRTN